nr:hypothetical protein [Thermodesulfovibrio aggregans]
MNKAITSKSYLYQADNQYLNQTFSEFETKYLLFILFGLGAIAIWSGSEAVLPAYIVGMVLAGTAGKDHQLIRRL